MHLNSHLLYKPKTHSYPATDVGAFSSHNAHWDLSPATLTDIIVSSDIDGRICFWLLRKARRLSDKCASTNQGPRDNAIIWLRLFFVSSSPHCQMHINTTCTLSETDLFSVNSSDTEIFANFKGGTGHHAIQLVLANHTSNDIPHFESSRAPG